MTFLCTPMHREKALKTPAGRSPVRRTGCFLFQQVILHSRLALSAVSKIFFPVGTAFAEQNRVNPSRVPVTNLEMERADSARIRANHATGSEPASRQVPTSNWSMIDGFVFLARISIGR